MEPYYLLFHWSAWYVWAWCRTRQDFRLFKLGRMTDLSPGAPFFPRPAPLPDLEPTRVFPATYTVTILFHPRYQWRLVEEYGTDSFTPTPDGRPRFVGTFPDEDSILSWLLTFGDGAELLEPPALRTRLRQLGGGLGPAIPRLTRLTEPKGGVPMASHKAFVDYITEQLGGAGEIRAKTMFGEYGLYCDGQFFAVICEDQLFLKCTPPGGGRVPPTSPKPRPTQGPGIPCWWRT